MEHKDIEKLAQLARIDLSDAEKEALFSDVESILEYVNQIDSVDTSNIPDKTEAVGELRNVMREDREPHESGIHTEELLKEAPAREGNYIKVKNIL